jgi:hypothetical protein
VRGIIRLGVVVLVVAGSAGNAAAATIPFTDMFNPADILFDNSGGTCTGDNDTDTVSGQAGGKCSSLSFVHTITGFSDPPDTLNGATLSLFFQDDEAGESAADKVEITLGSSPTFDFTLANSNTPGSSSPGALTVTALVTPGGLLTVQLERKAGDFYFAHSVLSGSFESNPTVEIDAVPEPANLVLLGIGLFAIARTRLKRRRQ